jgi:hypothetical protein
MRKLKKKIAFDLDGVVYDMVPQLDAYFESQGLKLKKPECYELKDRYGTSKEISGKILSEFGDTRPFLTMPLIEGAKQEMLIRSKYCELYVVTFRDWTPHGIEDTLERIKRDELPIKEDHIIFSHEKGDIAKKLGINVFYEDNLDNARDIVNKSDSTVVLIHTPYNEGEIKRTQRIKW